MFLLKYYVQINPSEEFHLNYVDQSKILNLKLAQNLYLKPKLSNLSNRFKRSLSNLDLGIVNKMSKINYRLTFEKLISFNNIQYFKYNKK